MTKVWRSTGAVAVYSPVRAVAVLFLALLLVGAAGFAGGLIVDAGGDDTAAVATAASSHPDRKLEPIAAADYSPDDDKLAAERKEAYRSGYKRGLGRGLARSVGRGGVLAPNAAYVVTTGGSAERITRRYRLRASEQYWLCRGGNALCIRDAGR